MSNLTRTGPPKAQRTSKNSQKLVVLPSAPQTKPLPSPEHDLLLSPPPPPPTPTPTPTVIILPPSTSTTPSKKSPGELMSKTDRKKAGFKRLTAYCVAESLYPKILTSFLKREHNVTPRVFDEAVYVVYHLPLLPGYGPETNIRSSPTHIHIHNRRRTTRSAASSPEVPSRTPTTTTTTRGSYDTDTPTSSSPLEPRRLSTIPESHNTLDEHGGDEDPPTTHAPEPEPAEPPAEAVFFTYGVIVFFGLSERQERDIIEDVRRAGVMKRPFSEGDGDTTTGLGVVDTHTLGGGGVNTDGVKNVTANRWEVEECHFVHDPTVAYPRVYNDFFTLKSPSPSPLQTLSISHALAQSTLLAHYETTSHQILHSPLALSIPTQLAREGGLRLGRREAMRLTGRLFRLRRDVILVKGVLDVPEVFAGWGGSAGGGAGSGSGAGAGAGAGTATATDTGTGTGGGEKGGGGGEVEGTERGGEGRGGGGGELYEAVREYFEIKPRVRAVNEKLGVASEFLDAIHDHLNTNEMTRITWIVIWLIVIAVLVELGEILARLVAHATLRDEPGPGPAPGIGGVAREEALRVLERMMTTT